MDWVRTPVTFPSKTLGSWASLLIPLGFKSNKISHRIFIETWWFWRYRCLNLMSPAFLFLINYCLVIV